MPEDTQRERMLRVLDRLDGAVADRMGACPQRARQPAHALVVIAADRRACGADRPRRTRAGDDLHVVVDKGSGRTAMAVSAGDVGQMLLELTAVGHGDDLQTPADAQDQKRVRVGGVALVGRKQDARPPARWTAAT
jgi:hypothetical protein